MISQSLWGLIRKPWLFLPSRWLYTLSPFALKIYSQFRPAKIKSWKSFHWQGISFPNPLGTAGGVDKNALLIKEWKRLGAGFIEIGTITPKAQTANSGRILDRSFKELSLWNNMGFPNKGLNFVKEILSKEKLSQTPPLFINIGKNRDTPLSQAVEDYKEGLKALHPFAKAFVINISSPNTKDLRGLFDEKHLPSFLQELKQTMTSLHSNIPLILKLSPDEPDFFRIIEQSLQEDIDGWCLCNSTKERKTHSPFPERGGISGQLLAEKSLKLLKKLNLFLKNKKLDNKLVISCGGVLSAQDVSERLQAGAHLVQVYSALVFEGPGFFKSVAKELSMDKTS